MHELSLAGGILQVVEDAAAREAFARVLQLRLEVGKLAGVELQALRFALEAIAPGTLLEGADIVIDEPPGRAWCMGCSTAVEIAQRGDEVAIIAPGEAFKNAAPPLEVEARQVGAVRLALALPASHRRVELRQPALHPHKEMLLHHVVGQLLDQHRRVRQAHVRPHPKLAQVVKRIQRGHQRVGDRFVQQVFAGRLTPGGAQVRNMPGQDERQVAVH